MKQEKLDKILEEHKLWLKDEGGERAILSGADLRGANLIDADLKCADLRGVNLRDADLRCADLSGVSLMDTDLKCADLRYADLKYANLSGAKGMIKPSEYIKENFETTKEGVIVYKSFGEYYPNNWDVKEGAVIEEECHPDRTLNCFCGINFGTKYWVEENCRKQVWKCLIKWEWLAGVVVPYSTDGKCRCEKLKVLHKEVK